MTKAQVNKIRRALEKAYPTAESIEQNQWGNWEVTTSDGYEEEIYTFAVEGSGLRFLGITRVEI